MYSIKKFKVAGSSIECNDVGQYGILLVDEEGSSYKVGATMQQIDKLNLDFEEMVAVGCVEGIPQFESLGLQYIEKVDDMSKENLESLWA